MTDRSNKRFLLYAVIFFSAALFLMPAGALALTVDFGADSSIDTSGTNAALQMHADINAALDSVVFDLEEGETSDAIYFATLGTTETWINNDDLDPGSMTAYIDFDIPDVSASVLGESIGFSSWWGFEQGWNLHWDDPVEVAFDGGVFSIELNDVSYASWFWQGPDGSACRPGTADVYARVTYKSASVPDASIMLLLGPSLIGLGLWGRKRGRSS